MLCHLDLHNEMSDSRNELCKNKTKTSLKLDHFLYYHFILRLRFLKSFE